MKLTILLVAVLVLTACGEGEADLVTPDDHEAAATPTEDAEPEVDADDEVAEEEVVGEFGPLGAGDPSADVWVSTFDQAALASDLIRYDAASGEEVGRISTADLGLPFTAFLAGVLGHDLLIVEQTSEPDADATTHDYGLFAYSLLDGSRTHLATLPDLAFPPQALIRAGEELWALATRPEGSGFASFMARIDQEAEAIALEVDLASYPRIEKGDGTGALGNWQFLQLGAGTEEGLVLWNSQDQPPGWDLVSNADGSVREMVRLHEQGFPGFVVAGEPGEVWWATGTNFEAAVAALELSSGAISTVVELEDFGGAFEKVADSGGPIAYLDGSIWYLDSAGAGQPLLRIPRDAPQQPAPGDIVRVAETGEDGRECGSIYFASERGIWILCRTGDARSLVGFDPSTESQIGVIPIDD